MLQYQVKSDFFEWQGMGARNATHNIRFEDCQNVADHGKFNSAGATHFIRSNIKKSLGNNYGEGTRNLVSHLADNFPALVGGKHMGSAGIYLIDRYIYMFVTEDVIDEAAVEYGSGYSVSSKYTYYLRKGNNMEILQYQNKKRVCDFDPCMNFNWGCLLLPRNLGREAEIAPLGSSKII